LTRIDNADLNLFDFDYDLTFMVFFLNAEEKVYARYGGRDAESPDSRQSLEGLHYTMKSVLAMHERHEKVFAPKAQETPQFIRDGFGFRRGGRCLHCHNVKEILIANLQKTGQWSREMGWRYPLPENVGLVLEVDRGNVVKAVNEASPAALAGLRAGDVVQWLNRVPTHSIADVQFALDRAPKAGSIEIAWQRGEKLLKEKLSLTEGWRKTDIGWRPSLYRLVPSARLYGTDLTPEEKKTLGLPANQLAFRQRDSVHSQARAAGVRSGDIILGIDAKSLEGDVDDFLQYVKRHYFIGDQVTINILRDGKRMNLTMTLVR
jgi:hypothetical protein